MIFDVMPSQIEKLDSKQLVELLKKLLYAEAQKCGISLSGINVPLQITVPDGGEDARISWMGGLECTDYLPCRFCIFQSKATNLDPSRWKKEVWTKNSQKRGAIRKLNEAVTKAISEHGSYIGFTSVAKGGVKCDKLIEGIKQGIRDAGYDPDRLKAVEIYDTNKIAEWTSRHPAVAVWLSELQSGFVLRGFRTINRWGKNQEISSIHHVEDIKERFSINGKDVFDQMGKDTLADNAITFQQAKERITDHLSDSQKAVRLFGPSGVGKTRLVYEVFRDETTFAKMSLSTSAIYCDFRDIGNQIFEITQSLSDSGSPALIIVDECPREAADRLNNIVATGDSQFRILTIGIDDRPIKRDNCLNILVSPANDSLVEGIIRQRFPKADGADVSFIQNLSGGYPRIAVLATDNYSENAPILKSIEDVVERILLGCNLNQEGQVRAIECLSLFTRLGADEELSGEIDFVANTFARQTGDEMYEHLSHAFKHHLVDRRGRFFTVQPFPIAVFLGARRLDLLRVKTVLQFIENAPDGLLIPFISQFRYFDISRTAPVVAERLLAIEGKLGSLEALITEFGSRCLDAFVHVNPDIVTDTINRVFGKLSIEELYQIKDGRSYLIWALEKLVFRKKSFLIAARLLMRLAAANNGTGNDNAAGKFTQIFQLELSGTEAEPSDRFAVLDEGILSGDDRVLSICVDALERTLVRGSFYRTGGSEQIGNRPPLKDWKPKLWSDVFDFHRNGLHRLDDIRSKLVQFAERCEKIIASHLRILLCENLFEDIENVIRKIVKEKGIWLEGIEGVGDWLYFDRKKNSKDFSKKVRGLYEKLMPTDPIQKALLYTKFWSGNIRDPEIDYDPNDSSIKDFEYSSRKAKEVAANIAADKHLTQQAIQIMAKEDLKNAFPFAHELAFKVEDPLNVFQIAMKTIEDAKDQKGIQFICGMLSGIDAKDKKAADACMKIANQSEALKDLSIYLYSAISLSADRLKEIIGRLKEGSIIPASCAFLSYGRRMDNLGINEILPLIDELANNHGADGRWTAFEIVTLYQHGRNEVDRQLAEWIKQQITSPKLFGKVRNKSRDGYLFENLIQLLRKYSYIDDKFAIDLSRQITRLCQVKDYEVFFELDDPARKIIKLLVVEKPKQLWEVISRFFEIATPLESRRLEQLTGPSSHGTDRDNHNKEGMIFGVPEKDCIDWANADPELRSPFLCYFYPLFEETKLGEKRWHSSLEKLTNEFGGVTEFRQALARRFYPRSWWGSIIPHLQIYLKPLKTWFVHPVPEMSRWARERYRSIEKQITQERNREDERHIKR